jgi:hypothetical protein
MSMRSELSISAVRSGWKARGTEFSWRLISESLRNSDVLPLLVLAVIGLLLGVSLTLLYPLPDSVAAALGQFS